MFIFIDHDLKYLCVHYFKNIMEANTRMYIRDLKILENYETSLSSHPRLSLFENSLYENNMPTQAEVFMSNMQAFSYINNVMEDGEELDKLEAET